MHHTGENQPTARRHRGRVHASSPSWCGLRHELGFTSFGPGRYEIRWRRSLGHAARKHPCRPCRSRSEFDSQPSSTRRHRCHRDPAVTAHPRTGFQNVEMPVDGKHPEIPDQPEASDQEVVPGAVIPSSRSRHDRRIACHHTSSGTRRQGTLPKYSVSLFRSASPSTDHLEQDRGYDGAVHLQQRLLVARSPCRRRASIQTDESTSTW